MSDTEATASKQPRPTKRRIRRPVETPPPELDGPVLDPLGNPIPGWTRAEQKRLGFLISLPDPRSDEVDAEIKALWDKRSEIKTEANDVFTNAAELSDLIKRDSPSLSSKQYAWIFATLVRERDKMLDVFRTLRTLQLGSSRAMAEKPPATELPAASSDAHSPGDEPGSQGAP